MKYSKQREIIYEVLKNNPVHPSADELYERIKPENPSLSLGTVYRNLRQMSKNGMIREIAVPGQKDRFDANLMPHQHFFCHECGRMMDIFLPEEEDRCGEVADKYGFRVEGSELCFYGTCAECITKLN